MRIWALIFLLLGVAILLQLLKPEAISLTCDVAMCKTQWYD